MTETTTGSAHVHTRPDVCAHEPPEGLTLSGIIKDVEVITALRAQCDSIERVRLDGGVPPEGQLFVASGKAEALIRGIIDRSEALAVTASVCEAHERPEVVALGRSASR